MGRSDSKRERADPINEAVHGACGGAVEQHGSCDSEDLCANAEHEALRAAVDGGGGDCIGKARDGQQRAAPCEFGDLVKDAERSERDGKCDQNDGTPGGGGVT